MNYWEATRILEEDISWLQDKGFIDENRTIKEREYSWLMGGKLKLPPKYEIQILRRFERLTSLSHQIDYLKSEKARFSS